MLTLYEELHLLSIHEDKGIFIGTVVDRLRPGLVGSILAELALAGKISTTNNRRLQLADASSSKDPILDSTLTALKKSEKERKFGYWLHTLSPKPEKLHKKITASLVGKGIVTQEEDHLAWVIPSPLYPEIKASTKYCLIQHLRAVVLARESAQLHDIALLSLLSGCDLIDLAFLRDERKAVSRTINELVVGGALQDPLLETVQEIVSAIEAVVE
ncbi:MAG: GPP34 family phosphoprotein [Anaerolineales bacterium]